MARLTGGRLISEAKVTDYLLNPEHAAGKSKAAYFVRFGFSIDRYVDLLEALLAHPEDNGVVNVDTNEFGIKSVVECHLKTPDGRNPCIRSVWFLETGSKLQRLVTAYPLQND